MGVPGGALPADGMHLPSGVRVVKASEFKAKCLQLMDEVAASGEEIIITKRAARSRVWRRTGKSPRWHLAATGTISADTGRHCRADAGTSGMRRLRAIPDRVTWSRDPARYARIALAESGQRGDLERWARQACHRRGLRNRSVSGLCSPPSRSGKLALLALSKGRIRLL